MELTDQTGPIAKLQAQNEALRQEVASLSKVLQEALQKQRSKAKESHRPHFATTDPELAELHSRITRLKRQRDTLKQELSIEDTNGVDLENRLCFLRQQLGQLNQEKQTLLKLQPTETSSPLSDTHQQLKDELKRTREAFKDLSAKMKSEEAQWKLDHQKMVSLELKVREANSSAKAKPQASAQAAKVQELRNKIDSLRRATQVEDKKGKRLVSEAESTLHSLQEEVKLLERQV